ncbi:hypothetical protein [Methylobacterium sp. 285MFTsu5.1]|uniref:hypothetical protein n=1 Tax=Methylobacterium sp. 285MFTsu5.1 TaxID=1172187 RepID=UPI001319FA0D|nr:hypothetical protein [Methylobacterium sp. 285MFTsu5.1]
MSDDFVEPFGVLLSHRLRTEGLAVGSGVMGGVRLQFDGDEVEIGRPHGFRANLLEASSDRESVEIEGDAAAHFFEQIEHRIQNGDCGLRGHSRTLHQDRSVCCCWIRRMYFVSMA